MCPSSGGLPARAPRTRAVVAGCGEGVGWVRLVDGHGVHRAKEQEHEKLVEASYDRAQRARQACTGGIVACFAQALLAKASEDNGQANGQWPSIVL